MTLSGWTYRKSHVLSGVDLTDYQVKIRVYRSEGTDSGDAVYIGDKCLADFGDIRFTSSDGDTELSYWLESNETTYADFWVKTDTTTAGTTIYIYYGNSEATTTSDGESTFLFFDDFTSLDTSSKWTITKKSTTYVSVESGNLKITTTNTSAHDGGGIVTQSALSLGTAYIIESNTYRLSGKGAGEPGIRVGITDKTTLDSTHYGFYNADIAYAAPHYWYSNYSKYYDTCYGTASSTGTTSLISPIGKWVRSSIVINKTAKSTATAYLVSGTTYTFTASGASTVINPDYIQLCYGEYQLATYIYISFVAVRQYTATEPTQGAWGDEEIIGATQYLTISNSPSSGSVPLDVNFTVDIVGSLNEFSLNFGDGNVFNGPYLVDFGDMITTYPSPFTYDSISYRNVVPSEQIYWTSNKIRIKLVGSIISYHSSEIYAASIVERNGETSSGTTLPTQITFNNGDSGIILYGNSYVMSDWLDYTLYNDRDYLVIIDYLDLTDSGDPGYTGLSYYANDLVTWDTISMEWVSGTSSSVRSLIEIEQDDIIFDSSFETTHTYEIPGTYTVFASGVTEFASVVFDELSYEITASPQTVVTSFTYLPVE